MKSRSCRNEVVHSGEVIEDSPAKEVKIRPPIGLALEHLYIGWSGVKPWADETDRSPEKWLCVAS